MHRYPDRKDAVEAVASINQRILQIQSQIAQISAPVVASSTRASSATSSASFGQVLTQEVARTATQTTPPASSAPTAGTGVAGSGKHQVNAKGVPVELIPYGNGKVPAHALDTIAGTRHTLWSPAARSFEALQSAAAADGITIGITDSYRTYESQVDLVKRKGLYSEGGLAARPGTSNHGWGLALDLALDSRAQAWMRTNAREYGFVEDVPREPWHWTYRPTH